MESQFHSVERVKLRRPPSWLSRLGDAVARFLGKMIFFATMFGLGVVGASWLSPLLPDPETATTIPDFVKKTSGHCYGSMWFVRRGLQREILL